ncbi:MAG: 2,5-diketo-D-gluconate reductase, partial [Tardiphaga sp.]|nr:2,5-diketo-D-gluconate reductase [Tardiphaga sp.]
MDTITTQGIRLPKLGLGTFKMTGDACRAAVESAIALGYRHIDTAEMYGNEAPIGEAIAASGVARAELHVTTKVWHDHLTRDGINAAFAASLEKLKLDHVDLYLVHWPAPNMDLAEIFDTMMTLMDEGRVRAIGVCNFPVALLRTAIEDIKAPIASRRTCRCAAIPRPSTAATSLTSSTACR